MTLSALALFAAAYLVALASPGPGIAALVGRVLARGPRGIGAFIAGCVVGDLTWFLLAATGLALLAHAFAAVFVALKYAGAAYLLVLAWRAWTAPAEALDAGATPPRGSGARLFLAGLALTLGNPKVILFFLALLPTLLDLGRLTAVDLAEIALTMMVLQASVLALYALAAARARRLLTSARAMRAVNRGAGALMAGAAVAVATR